MSKTVENIHPVDAGVSRAEREAAQGHRGFALWMTGMSGSGKSTVARALERRLFEEGYRVVLLDGDNLRTGINAGLGFTDEDRTENIRRASNVAKLFVEAGQIAICSFISPKKSMRDQAASILGDDFALAFVSAPFDVCQARDVKGLYAKLAKGEIANFTGQTSDYESPENPDLDIPTHLQTLEESVQTAVDFIHQRAPLTQLNAPLSNETPAVSMH